MESWEQFRVKPGQEIRLAEMSTDSTAGYGEDGKIKARKHLYKVRKRIDELVRVLATEQRPAVLVVLQGMDAAGKDGAVRHVFTGVNPQNCQITSFKEPSRLERAHDFLWRVHQAVPPTGMLGVFNRSQYEDVLVARGRGEMSAGDARLRLGEIADFERMLASNRVTILKFFLHISRAEQARRFERRLDRPDKQWKVEGSDFRDRDRWPEFQRAYEEAIECTMADWAPWFIVPADYKWFRDVVIAEVLLEKLRDLHPAYPAKKADAEPPDA